MPATEASRLLEWPSVGSVVLTWKLLGWAHAESLRAGGLDSDRCKEAASAFLNSVLVVAGQGSWKLVLFYDALDVPEAAWPWKRYGKHHVLLPVERGHVDIRALGQVANQPVSVITALMAILQQMPDASSVPLAPFVEAVCQTWPQKAHPLYQVAWQIGQRLDDIAVAAQQGRKFSTGDFFSVSKHDPMSFGQSGLYDNRLLQAYGTKTLQEFSKQPHISFTVDKARVFGKSFFDGLLAKPSGMATWAPPLDH